MKLRSKKDEVIEPELDWSREAVVSYPSGEWNRCSKCGNQTTERVESVFQMGTYAVRATYPDGRILIRVLPPGTMGKWPNLEGDMDFRKALIAKFKDQKQAVVFE